MNNKKKQTAVMAMATVLSVTSMASPLTVMAQEDNPVPPVIIQEENGQQETAPDISLPKKLQATAGMTLQEITLPEDWTWVDDSTLITAETAEYPARFSVDDVSYDYSNVEGYNAEGHYVERMVAVTVEPAKQEPAELMQKKSYALMGNVLATLNDGNIAINATNFPDETFRNYVKASFDTDTSGSLSATEIAGITRINVSENKNVKDLTGIKHFTALEVLLCWGTGITSLDVSNNTSLTKLNINSTEISSLDISKNINLYELRCGNTKITSLDVSNNKALTVLAYFGPMPYLSTGTKNNITTFSVTGEISLVLEMEEDSFDIADKFAGIDITKVTNVRSADYDSSTGIMSNYKIGVGEAIIYTYNCGTSAAGKEQKMFVTVIPVAKSTISITENLNKPYDGNAVSDKPTVSKTEGTWNQVSYKWEKKVNAIDWEEIASAPADLGTYRVTATLAPSNNYSEATSAPVEFTISQGESTISVTDDLDKTYDKTAVNTTLNVSTTGSSGAVSFKWEQKKSATDWEQITSAPTDAGAYRVTANLASDSNYKGATTMKEFTISQAELSYTVPQDLEATFGQTLADVKLSAGFSWTYDTLAVGNAGKNTFTAVFTPDDTKNYKTVADISVALTVKKADNALTDALSIEGWTYGDTPAVASAGFRFGKPRFLYSDKADGIYTETVPTNAGTWYVKAVVDGTGNYEGAESDAVSFVIALNDVTTDSQITVPDITADTNLDELVIKDGDKVLVQDTDYNVSKTQDGKNVTVTITFKGNYTGTIIKTYTVKENVASGGDSNKSEGTNTEDKKAVQTGDTTAVGLWSTILAFSAGLAVFLKRKKQRKETEE